MLTIDPARNQLATTLDSKIINKRFTSCAQKIYIMDRKFERKWKKKKHLVRKNPVELQKSN